MMKLASRCLSLTRPLLSKGVYSSLLLRNNNNGKLLSLLPRHYSGINWKVQEDNKEPPVTFDTDSSLDHFLTAIKFGDQATVLKHYEENKNKRIAGIPTFMHIAAKAGQANIVRLLAKLGEDPTALDDKFMPLHYAIASLNLETIGVFLHELGVSVNPKGMEKVEDVISPLIMAILFSSPSVINYLIDNGANVNQVFGGQSTLYLTSTGPLEHVKILIERGADLHQRDSSFVTPIHRAIVLGKLETVKYFLTKSKIRMDLGWLLMASQRGDLDIFKLLLDRVDNISEIFHEEHLYSTNVVVHLEKCQSKVNPAFIWAHTRSIEIHDLLIKKGVPLPKITMNQFAVMAHCKKPEVMDLYVQKGWLTKLCALGLTELAKDYPLLYKLMEKEKNKNK